MGVLCDYQIRQRNFITPFAEMEKRAGRISWGCGSYGYDVRADYVAKIFSPIGATVIDPKNFDPKALVTVDLTPTLHDMDGEQCKRCKRSHRFTDYTAESFPKQQCYGEKGELPHTPDHFLLPPHSFMLVGSMEEFDIPRDVHCLVVGKSTYARCGIIVNVTPGEPEWKGKWTIEISNTTPLPVKIYPGEGIMQCIFLRSDGVTEQICYWMEEVFKAISRMSWIAGFKNALTERLFGTCETSYKDRKGKYNYQEGLTLPKVEK